MGFDAVLVHQHELAAEDGLQLCRTEIRVKFLLELPLRLRKILLAASQEYLEDGIGTSLRHLRKSPQKLLKHHHPIFHMPLIKRPNGSLLGNGRDRQPFVHTLQVLLEPDKVGEAALGPPALGTFDVVLDVGRFEDIVRDCLCVVFYFYAEGLFLEVD